MKKNRKASEVIIDLFRSQTLVFLLIVIAVFLTIRMPVFLTSRNLLNLLKNMSVQGVIAFGMTMVLVSGELDLSVGKSVALSTIIIAWTSGTLSEMGIMSIESAAIVGVILAFFTSLLTGLLNFFFIVKCRIPAMIATLAMQNVLYGIAATISGGFPLMTLPSGFSAIGSGKVFGIPVPVIVLLILFAFTFYLLSYTAYGRAVFAVGGNAEAARLSGIRVERTKMFSFVLIQLCCWVSAVLLVGQVMSGNASLGTGYEMNAISSVVIGGASISGGIGNMAGTLLGILFLQVLSNGMTLLNISAYVQYVVRGGLLVGAVLLSTFKNKKR